MFGLADRDRLERILVDAGWRDVDIASRTTSVLVGGGGSLDEIVAFLRTGTMGRMMLDEVDADTERGALAGLGAALSPYLGPDGVRLDAAVWDVSARA